MELVVAERDSVGALCSAEAYTPSPDGIAGALANSSAIGVVEVETLDCFTMLSIAGVCVVLEKDVVFCCLAMLSVADVLVTGPGPAM